MEALNNYFQKRKSKISATTALMAIYLMYLHDDMKGEIKKLAKHYNLTDYILDPPAEAVSYSRSLPNALYTNQMYDTEEYFLAQSVGFYYLEQYEYKELHDHIFNYVHTNFPNYAVIFFNSESYDSMDK
jgi:hypothetical protein